VKRRRLTDVELSMVLGDADSRLSPAWMQWVCPACRAEEAIGRLCLTSFHGLPGGCFSRWHARTTDGVLRALQRWGLA
jgi:hypothetical protein